MRSLKTINYWMFAAMFILCGATMSLSSCSDSDDTVQQTEDVIQKLALKNMLVGMHPDVSEAIMGSDDVTLWDFKDDGTFHMLNVTMSDQMSDEDVLNQEIIEGTWEPIVNVEHPFADTEARLQGFKATFNYGDEAHYDDHENTATFYVDQVTAEDGQPVVMILSETALGYLTMLEELEDAENEGTRGFKESFFGFFVKIGVGIVKAATAVAKAAEVAGRFFVNAAGLDIFSNLTMGKSMQFYDEAKKIIDEMQKDSKTNYSEWMTEIYTKQGKDPRICDMNIPGTHDTFTAYFKRTMNVALPYGLACPLIPLAIEKLGDYTISQLKDIPGQWEAGVRSFDMRIGTAYKDKSQTEKVIACYHGPIYLRCLCDEGLQYIVDQLDKHPGETAVVSMSFEDKHGDAEHKMVKDILQKFVDKGKVVTNPRPDMKLSDCKGKMIVMQDWDKENNTPQYRIGPGVDAGAKTYKPGTIKFYGTPDQVVTYEYQNLYEMESLTQLVSEFWKSKRNVMEQCFNATAKTKGQSTPVWALNQVNAYVGLKHLMSYSKNSNVMNPWTSNYVFQHKKDKMGIIQMDFAGTNDKFDGYYTNGEALPRIIVESNRYQ